VAMQLQAKVFEVVGMVTPEGAEGTEEATVAEES
jgi:hypothetical protein